jgi:hypothetical protein
LQRQYRLFVSSFVSSLPFEVSRESSQPVCFCFRNRWPIGTPSLYAFSCWK